MGKLAQLKCETSLYHMHLRRGSSRCNTIASETIMYNVIDSPCGCIPVTRVDASKDSLSAEWTSGSYVGSPLMESRLYRGNNPLYNVKSLVGMPVGVQVVGRRWEEERVLAMMKVLDDALGKDRGFGPGAIQIPIV